MKTVHVAVGVLLRAGRVLIARRPEGVHQGGLLEFPGGKVEPGETVQQALCREVAEETGLTVTPEQLQPLINIRHDYGDKRVLLDVWIARDVQGEAEGREGQSIQWLAPEALRDEDFPAANRPIIRALRLPDQLAITGDIRDPEAGLQKLRLALSGAASPPLVVLRAPALESPPYVALALEAARVCDRAGAALVVHGEPGVFDRVPGACGVHLPWHQAERYTERPVPDRAWLGVSCHNEPQLRHAEKLGADYVTLGNVLPTPSHPGREGLGWARFGELVAHAAVPVYGLGGLALAHRSKAQAEGAQGIAGISFWWS